MSKLYPTPTRLALLRDIRDGKVRQYRNGENICTTRWNAVNAATRDMRSAGWIEPGTQWHEEHGGRHDPPASYRLWELAGAGRAVLFAAEHPDKHLSGPCAAGDCDDCGARDCEHNCPHEGRRRFVEQMHLTGGAL